jgi:hypothetical protein
LSKDKLKQDKGKGKGSPHKRARNEETNVADNDLQLSSVMIEMADKVAPSGIVLSRLRAKVPKKASDPFSYAIFGTFALSCDNTTAE